MTKKRKSNNKVKVKINLAMLPKNNSWQLRHHTTKCCVEYCYTWLSSRTPRISKYILEFFHINKYPEKVGNFSKLQAVFFFLFTIKESDLSFQKVEVREIYHLLRKYIAKPPNAEKSLLREAVLCLASGNGFFELKQDRRSC